MKKTPSYTKHFGGVWQYTRRAGCLDQFSDNSSGDFSLVGCLRLVLLSTVSIYQMCLCLLLFCYLVGGTVYATELCMYCEVKELHCREIRLVFAKLYEVNMNYA